MNVLPQAKREQLIALLVEGNSIRGTARVADVAYNTVLKFVPEIGAACEAYHSHIAHHLTCQRLQLDEIWSFVGKKKDVGFYERMEHGYGDCWTFVAIDPDTKFVPCWFVGARTHANTRLFIADLKSRLVNRPQISTDGYKAYKTTIGETFKEEVDFGMLIKIYEDDKTDPQTLRLVDKVGITPVPIFGHPDLQKISTSYVERQNLTMRQSMRRFVRRTNGHSKKVFNHAAAIALHFMHYNFCRIHTTLRVTPAMAAGLSDHAWDLGELVALTNHQGYV